MIHNYNIYYFINDLNKDEILNLNKNINIIYRNYHQSNIEKTIKEIKVICKASRRRRFISNNLNLALKYNLDGLYLPSFNKNLNFKNMSSKKNFKIIGSAHNFLELKIKEKQGCEEIFISPLFYNPKNKNFLGIVKFNNLYLFSKKKIIALGGINQKNINKLKCTKAVGFAGISWIKKNGPSKT